MSTGMIFLGGERGGLSATSQMIPEFMREDKGAGTQEVLKFVRPPRLKVMQANRGQPLKQFEEGSVVLMPAAVPVAKNNEPFYFVTLLMYPEYITMNPWKLKAKLPMVRERSLDPAGEIARKSRDPELRGADVCPEDPTTKLLHCEVLTFIVLVMGQAPIPAVLSFARAEHKQGQMLAQQIAMRHPAPIFGCVFEGIVPEVQRSNDQGSWYGINVGAPSHEDSPPPFIQDPQEYKEIREMHLQLKAKLEEDLIQVDHEYDDDGDSTAAPSDSAKTM